MSVAKNVSEYIKDKNINVSAMARATGISLGTLYQSVSPCVEEKKRRQLRDDEFIAVCKYLEKNPMDFADKHVTVAGG